MTKKGSHKVIKQILIIIATAMCLGTLANAISPRRLPWSQDWANRVSDAASVAGLQVVDLAATRVFVEAGEGFILDARPFDAFGDGHLPGAFNLPVSTLQESYPDIAPMLMPDTPILVYCTGKECEESMELGTFLQEQGFTNILVFVGGYTEWSDAQASEAP